MKLPTECVYIPLNLSTSDDLLKQNNSLEWKLNSVDNVAIIWPEFLLFLWMIHDKSTHSQNFF